MADLFNAYLRAGLYGSIVILIGLVLRPLFRNVPRRILCMVWLLASVRLLLPFSLESHFSLQPRYTPTVSVPQEQPTELLDEPMFTTPVLQPVPVLPEVDIDYEQLPQDTPVAPETQGVPAPDIDPVVPEQPPVENPHPVMPEQPVAGKPAPAAPKTVDVMRIISAVWVTVMAAVWAYGMVSYMVLKRRVQTAVRCVDGILECKNINCAFLLGYLKPEIYLPAGIESRERGFIIAHEQTHKKGGDHWWKLVGLLCVGIHWYNPLVWAGYALMCRDLEIACDEQVVRSMNLEERKAYSLALLNSGKRLSGVMVCPVAFGEVSLKQRIKKVLAYRQPGFWITAIAIALVVFVGACFLTSPMENPKPKPTPQFSETNPTTGADDEAFDDPTEPPATQSTEPSVEATEPSTEVTEPSVEATEPSAEVTEPSVEVTEPSAEVTEPSAEVTEPSVEVTEPSVEVTEPQPTDPPASKPTAPSHTENTHPPTRPYTEGPMGDPNIIDQGEVDHGPLRWKITVDGTLTFYGGECFQSMSVRPWHDYADVVKKIIIEDGVRSIPHDAFKGMYRAETLYLSKTVKRIDESAFAGCSSLKAVTIPAGVTVIPRYAFYGCSKLSKLEFAAGSQIRVIDKYAFYGSGLTSFESPATLEEIGFYAFENSKAMKSLILAGKLYVRKDAFKGCDQIKYLKIGEGVSGIGGVSSMELEVAEFYSGSLRCGSHSPKLHTVVIGGNITTIGYNAFKDCTALENLVLFAAIERIECNAFEGCSALKEIVIPDTVTDIGISAFCGSGLTRITIPASVTNMGWAVFEDSSLQEITFLGDAPIFENGNTFCGVSVKAYYPADNETWTEDKLQDYGGNVTWIPLAEKEETV